MTPAHRRPTTRLRLTVAALPLLALAACGSDAADDPGDPGSAYVTPTPEVTLSPTPTPTPEPASGDTPAWALPATTPGKPLATLRTGDLTVKVSQVATAVAAGDGTLVDPQTGKPVPAAGDTVVVVNYVVTNTGAPLDLGSALVDITARYDDPPYVPMVGLDDEALYEGQGVNRPGIVTAGITDSNVYPLGTGQRYSFGRNYPYRKGAPITFEAVFTPLDAAGESDGDRRVTDEARATLR